MILLVCGGRDYRDVETAFSVLDEIHQAEDVLLVVEGAAPGADLLAEDWAKARQIPYLGVPAPWMIHRKAAGPIRNGQMLDTRKLGLPFRVPISMVVAFPGGPGTANMVKQARAARVEVYEVSEHAQPRGRLRG